MADSPTTTKPAPLSQIGPIDKDREIARLTDLVIYYAGQAGVPEDVVRRAWKL